MNEKLLKDFPIGAEVVFEGGTIIKVEKTMVVNNEERIAFTYIHHNGGSNRNVCEATLQAIREYRWITEIRRFGND